MGRIVALTLITLDGVVERPHRWAPATLCAESAAISHRLVEQADALLLGRVTHRYLTTASTAGVDAQVAGRIGRMTTHVVSSTLPTVGEDRTTLVRGDPVGSVSALRGTTDRSYLVPGSPTLVRSLLPEGLVDELVLLQCPVVVGAGATLFPPGSRPLELAACDVQRLAGGRALLRFCTDPTPAARPGPRTHGRPT